MVETKTHYNSIRFIPPDHSFSFVENASITVFEQPGPGLEEEGPNWDWHDEEQKHHQASPDVQGTGSHPRSKRTGRGWRLVVEEEGGKQAHRGEDGTNSSQ